jgi:tRNA (guanine9-N1)-methyltransferase
VIGGLVDRTVAKGLSYQRARTRGVATARLPLKECLSRTPSGAKYLSRQCLPVDRVAQICMAMYRTEGNWVRAVAEAFPRAGILSAEGAHSGEDKEG